MNRNRLWGVVLGVSLTINVFCIAALVTQIGISSLGPGHRPPPPGAQALFREIDPRGQKGFREAINALRKHRGAVRSALTTEPFDANRLSAAFAELRQAELEKAALAHQKVSEVAARISADEREALSRFVEKHPRGPKHGPGNGGRHPRPPEPHGR